MVRTNEGGSILSFIIVGAILAVLLVGGVYTVRQHFNNGQIVARKPTTTQPAPSANNHDSAKDNEGQAADNSPTTPAPSKDQTSSQPPAPTTPTMPADTAPAPSSTGTTPSTQLPHTGPVATIVNAVALALLTGTTITYVRSRRQPISL